MPAEHRDVDVDGQLRAFAAVLEAHTAEPIRPSTRSVDDDVREPVVVEPTPMPPPPERRRVLLPAVAAAAAAIALVAGLVVLSDDATPSDTPTSTTTPAPTTTTPSTTTTPEEAGTDTGPIAVNYDDPLPELPLVELGSVELDGYEQVTPSDFAVAIGENGVAVMSLVADVAHVVDFDGQTRNVQMQGADFDSNGLPTPVRPSMLYGPGDVLYIVRAGTTPPHGDVDVFALSGDRAGELIVGGRLERDLRLERNRDWLYPPVAPLGHGRDGAVARGTRDDTPIEFGYVDETGAPTTFPGTPPHEVTTARSATQDDEDGIHDPLISSSTGTIWQLAIEGEFRPTPDNTYYVAAPSSGNRTVYAADVVSPEDETQTRSVLAILQPDGSGQWWNIPNGWHYAASDAWGTAFVKIDGNTVQLALLDSGQPTDTGGGDATAPAQDRPSIAATAVVGEPTPVAGTPYDEALVVPVLGAWDDGFLVVTVTGGVQMTADLSDEMFARFPPVVRAAYPDGIQGTMGDAIARLQEDGLLDEVQAALEADPELNEAVNGGPITPTEFAAEFSSDGETWTPVEIVAPSGIEPHAISIVGDRLVMVGAQLPLPLGDDPGVFGTLAVASTADLTNWSVQTAVVPDVVETLEDVPITMNERGWVTHIEPDRRPGEAGDGYEVGEGPPLTWAAVWAEEPIPVGDAALDEGAVVTAIASGFLAQHGEIEFSIDGLAWAPVPEAPTDVSIVGALPLDDGKSAVVTWAASCETQFYRVDQAGRGWERIDLDIDDAPRGLLPSAPFGGRPSSEDLGQTSASLFDTSRPLIETYRSEQDGFELTLRACGGSDSIPYSRPVVQYELVEIDTGDVVVAESGDRWPRDDPGAFEHLTIDDDGTVTVHDPSSGDAVLVADFDDAVFDVTGVGGPEDIWLLATANGTDWLVDDLVQISTDPPYRNPAHAVRNGDTVLVASAGGWLRYQLPDG